jgi:hypothetical protein
MATAKTQTKKTGNTVEAQGDVKFALPDARRGLYAYVGAADYAVEQIRRLPYLQNQLIAQVRELPQTLRSSFGELQERYTDFANRGEKLVTSIRKDPATTEAVEQAKTAKSQVKAARTSVRKAASDAADAADAATDKV